MATNPTSRRDFLTVGSLGFLGLTLRDTLAAAAASPAATAKANSVILFWLEGGPSHIDTFDPKPNSNFRPMSTNVAGIQVSELLPKFPQVMINVRVKERVDPATNPAIQAAAARVEKKLGATGRVVLRASGTEPVIRVMIEAREEQVAQACAEELAEAVRAAV